MTRNTANERLLNALYDTLEEVPERDGNEGEANDGARVLLD